MTDVPETSPIRPGWADRFARLIPPFDDAPIPQPPRTLWRFFAWCLRGSTPVLVVASIVSVLALRTVTLPSMM